nr:hypothetical protein [Escherichia coli]
MSFFSTLKTALSLKEKLAATGVLVLICALVGAGFAWERHQLKQAIEKIGSLDQAVKERDKSIMDLNQTIETMNKAEQHFHSQEVKNESEQAKYADRQWNEKLKFRNNWLRRVMFASAFLLTLSGCSGSRSANLTPTPTKVNHPAPKSAFMCRMPEFSSEYFDDLPAYILDTETMLMGINRKNRNVNDYNRAISGN